jgi:hypothetical protein
LASIEIAANPTFVFGHTFAKAIRSERLKTGAD